MNPSTPRTLRLLAALLCTAAASHALATPVPQQPTIVNGSFETVSLADSFSIGRDGTLTSWSLSPSPEDNHILNCLVYQNDSTSLCGNAFVGGMTFWVNPGASPSGGNYVAIDGDASYNRALTQTIRGLTVGQQYSIGFYQAAAQQSGFSGATTEQWQVTLGDESHLSTLMNNESHGSVGWMAQSLSFTATSASELLQFAAKGTPNGVPPFVLLDGVTIGNTPSGASALNVPEPGSLALAGLALLAIPAARRWQRRPR